MSARMMTKPDRRNRPKETKPVKIILNFVNTETGNDRYGNQHIHQEYSLVEREYWKYIKHCRKHGIKPLGTYQFIPADTYALMFWKEIGTESISLDYDDTYIVNLYTVKMNGKEDYFDFKAIKQTMPSVAKKVKEIFGDNYTLQIFADEPLLKVKSFICSEINYTFHKFCEFVNCIPDTEPTDEKENEVDDYEYYE